MYYVYENGYIEDVTASTKWTIENFCIGCKETEDCYSSPVFFSNGLKWRLKLYPVSKEDENCVAISLTLFTNVEVTMDKFSLSIINNDNQKFIIVGQRNIYFRHKTSRVCGRFIRHEELMNKKNRLLTNGSLVILCEIKTDFETYSDLEVDAIRLQTTKRIRMLENFFDFEQFLLNQKFCDVKFTVGDQKLPAHKVVLASKSTVFSIMFESNSVENQELIIDITDVDYNVFVEMLRFIYTRTTRDIKDMSKRLFIAADKYGLDDLKNLCVDSLVKELSKFNAIEYLSLADHYGLQSLRSKALDFVASNIDGLKSITK